MPPDLDVAVVGAGPAGCATAIRLAELGRSVLLLDRSEFPREKACGDGLTGTSMVRLAGLGLGPALDRYQRIRGTRLSFASGAEFTRAAPVGQARVVPRAEFDALLCEHARATGAVVRFSCRATGLLREADRTVGVRYRDGSASHEAVSRFVVVADGAGSALARQAGLSRPADRMGFAVRAYVRGLGRLTEEFHVRVPLLDPDSGRVLPGYGWVFPVSADLANVGVGALRLGPQDHEVNLRTVFRAFLASLRSTGPLQVGPLRGAPLPCEFDPDRCAAAGLVLVGDAARLVDPLSGEGIDTALESGTLAAELIDRALVSGTNQVAGYGAELRRRFGRRIGTAWSLVENHSFVWGVVNSVATVDRPLYRGVRHAVSSYDREEPAPPAGPQALGAWLAEKGLLADVRVVQRTVRDEIQSELPMLTGAVAELREEAAEQVRIGSLLVCAGALATAPWHRRKAIRLAAASELACLALAAHEDVLDTLPGDGPRAANLFAVSAGDYLLSRALRLAADVGAWAVRQMGSASAEVCAGVILDQSKDHSITPAARAAEVAALTTGTVFSLPVQLGARLAGTDPATLARLVVTGRAIGVAWNAAKRTDRTGPDALMEACTALGPHHSERALRELIRSVRI